YQRIHSKRIEHVRVILIDLLRRSDLRFKIRYIDSKMREESIELRLIEVCNLNSRRIIQRERVKIDSSECHSDAIEISGTNLHSSPNDLIKSGVPEDLEVAQYPHLIRPPLPGELPVCKPVEFQKYGALWVKLRQ